MYLSTCRCSSDTITDSPEESVVTESRLGGRESSIALVSAFSRLGMDAQVNTDERL